MENSSETKEVNKFKFLDDNFQITDKTLVVIDTNYLLYTLQSYYFGKKYIDALNKNLENLYIPYIVFIEFYTQKDNKVDRIRGQFESLPKAISFSNNETLIDINDQLMSNLNNNTFENFQLYQKTDNHIKYETDRFIENYREDFKQEIINSINSVNNKFTEIKNRHRNKIEETFIDPKKYTDMAEELETSLKQIINSDDVLGKSYDTEQFNTEVFKKTVKQRYDNKIGPGYKDGLSDEKNQFGTIFYPKGSGDLILWLDTINYIQKFGEKYDNVMFITSDNKSDWYQKKYNKINSHLKIEFYLETGKNIEIMKTEEYILEFADFTAEEKQRFTKDYASLREEQDQTEETSISDYLTSFNLLGEEFSARSQNEMMIQIINKLNYQYKVHSHHLSQIACFQKVNEMKENKDYLHTEDNKLFEINKSYNIYSKFSFIKQLFDSLDIEYKKLKFTYGFIKQYEASFQEIWEQTISN